MRKQNMRIAVKIVRYDLGRKEEGKRDMVISIFVLPQ